MKGKHLTQHERFYIEKRKAEGPFPNETQQTLMRYAASRYSKNTSFGELYSRDLRPRVLRMCSSLAISSSLTSLKSVPFG